MIHGSHKLPLAKCFDILDVIDPIILYSDKSHSMQRKEVLKHIQSKSQSPIPTRKVLSSLINQEETNWPQFLQQLDTSGARFSQSRNVRNWSSTYETESYCPRIRSLLVSKIFSNYVGITQPVFSLPSADFLDAVKTRQIRQRANYSCRRTNQRSFDNTFVYILYFAPFMNTHTNGCLHYHVAVETQTKLQ